MSPLRKKMENCMKLRCFAPKTQSAYISAVEGLAKHYKKSPDKLSKDDVQSYLLYLMEDRELAWSSCNVIVSGLKFFYNETLEDKSKKLTIPPRKKQNKLPQILSVEEIEHLLNCAPNPKHRVLLMTAYSAGLRVSEIVALKPVHIEKDRKLIRVEQGKGNKDRYTLLSDRLLKELVKYWRMYKPGIWFFPQARDQTKPMDISSAQRIFYSVKKRSGITKCKGIHTLRHCFATHLLESGTDIRIIQMLMGHKALATTMKYLQVSKAKLGQIKSPLDMIGLLNKSIQGGESCKSI